MPFGKQDGRHVLPEHDHFFLVEVVSFADEPALEGRGVCVNFAEVGLHPAEIDGRHLTGFRAHGVGMIPVRHQKRGYRLDRRAPLLDGLRVLNGKRFALAFLKWRRSAVPSLVPFGDERRIRAELFDVLLNLLVKAGHQRRHQHNHAHAQHNAEHGQPAAQLVGPQGVQRLFQVFAVCLSHIFSPIRAQSFDGIQLGRPHSRKDSEKETHSSGHAQGEDHGT